MLVLQLGYLDGVLDFYTFNPESADVDKTYSQGFR
jgi:hypothetical protein